MKISSNSLPFLHSVFYWRAQWRFFFCSTVYLRLWILKALNTRLRLYQVCIRLSVRKPFVSICVWLNWANTNKIPIKYLFETELIKNDHKTCYRAFCFLFRVDGLKFFLWLQLIFISTDGFDIRLFATTFADLYSHLKLMYITLTLSMAWIFFFYLLMHCRCLTSFYTFTIAFLTASDLKVIFHSPAWPEISGA